MISIVCCVLISAIFALYVAFSYKERKRLIELLAAKDYADYKNFECTKEVVPRRDKKNMFEKRAEKSKNQFTEVE